MNTTRRQFLSSLGLAAVAPMVVANALSEAAKRASLPVVPWGPVDVYGYHDSDQRYLHAVDLGRVMRDGYGPHAYLVFDRQTRTLHPIS